MIKRSLFFSNRAYLSLKNKQLNVSYPDSDTPLTVPIEDIGVIVLENRQITFTNGLFTALLENNAAVITCDASHMPNGLMLPLDGGHTQSERFRYQIEATLPLKKQLWQQTVQAKIHNQAKLLDHFGIPHENMLFWIKNVKSGDSENHEARAAIYYWSKLFPEVDDFTRERFGDYPNHLLNYGYAILRAITARSLVASGLLPTLGIFHKNKYNAYCLADDIMEPYRPFVDKLACEWMEENPDSEELTKEAKAHLMKIAQVDVRFESFTSPLMVGIQRTTASLAKCFEGSQRKINYPTLE
jgi:CRISPR-associated protein Cas1